MVVVEVNGYEIGPGADLGWANLIEADFTGANLIGVNFRRADLTGANLERAVADGRTVWPEGFDPKAAGVIFD